MKVSIFNIGKILSGDIASPVIAGDTIVMDGGKITSVGSEQASDSDVSIDAGGMMAMPGLIDSHGPHHIWRLYTAPKDGRLSGELHPWRRDHEHQRFGSSCARPAARPCRCEGSRDCRAKILR